MLSNQNNIKLTIHRGSHQIGGNCVELATPNTKILIDCGLPLDYDEQDPEVQTQIHEDAKVWLNDCDAIFLSHYHADHYGLLNEAPEGTKVYATKETAEMMKMSGMFGIDLTKHLDVQPIENTVTVKDFRITKYDVDHSAFGACAFLIEADGQSILYSGDIRLHGKKGLLYKCLPQDVDYLFLEGTNLGRGARQKTEYNVKDEFIHQFESNPDSAFLVWCSAQNIDRLVSIYNACLKIKRYLCVDTYTAYALTLAHQCKKGIPYTKTHPNLIVYYPNKFTNKLINKRPDIHNHIKNIFKKIDNKDPQKNPSKYVFVFRPNMLDFFNKHLANTSIRFVLSMWSQYWDKDNRDLVQFKNWLAAKPELRKKLPDIHTSGHADVESLQKIVEHIQPKNIIPIHTEHSEKFSLLFPNNSVMEVDDETQYSI